MTVIRKWSFDSLGEKMLESSKENTKYDNDSSLQEMMVLVNNRIEWRAIAEKFACPTNKIGNMIKKPSKNGKHENPETAKNTKWNESYLMDCAMKKIDKDTSTFKLVIWCKVKEGSEDEILIFF